MFAESRLLLGTLIVFSGLASAQPANLHAAMVLGAQVEGFISRVDWRCVDGDAACRNLTAATAADGGLGLMLGP